MVAGVLLALVAQVAISPREPTGSGLAPGALAGPAVGVSPIPVIATESADAARVFAEAGFQLVLPAGWSVNEEGADAVVISGPGRRMLVRIGDAAGHLPNSCLRADRLGFEQCSAVVVDVLDDFKNTFCDGCLASSRPDSLAGEAASRVRISGYEYVAALHDGRPYVVRFRMTYAFQPSAPGVPSWESILDTFQFVDAHAGSVFQRELQLAGLSLALPEGWERCHETNEFVFRPAAACAEAASRPYWVNSTPEPSVTVRLGTTGEPPTYCVGVDSACQYPASGECQTTGACTDVDVASLSNLWSALSREDALRWADSEQRDIEIDGGPGRVVHVSRELREGEITYEKTWLLTIRERPYVLIFAAPSGSMPDGWVQDIISSADFANPPGGQSTWETFTAAEAGFAIDLPQDWVEEPTNDPQLVWVHGGGGGLRVRVGDETGEILNCDIPAGSTCQSVHVESVETLVDLMTPPPGTTFYGPGTANMNRRPVLLGSIPAVQVRIATWAVGPSAHPTTRYYVVAVVGGRPIIIKWEPGSLHGVGFQRLLEGFRLLNWREAK